MSSDPTRPLPPPEWNQGPEGGKKQPPPGEPPTVPRETRPARPRPTFTPTEQIQQPQQSQPPQDQYRPPPQPYDPPTQQYEPPTQQYPSPQDQYQSPQGQYQPPQQQYQPPQQQYQPPQQQYQPPQQQAYDPRQQQYGYDQPPPYLPPAAQPGRARRRRRRWPIVTGVIVILLLLLAVGADRFACYEAENQMANKIQQNGLPVKPHVTIEGFPFLTQLAAKDFNEVVISASNVTEDGLTIQSINATLHGMHLIDGYTGARIDSLNGTALITYQALANAGGFSSALTLGPGANSSQLKATVSVPILGNASATVQLTRLGAKQFNVRVVNAGGIESSVLGNLANYTFTINELPAGMTIQSVAATQQGVVITITGRNTTLTQPSS
jgi:hypothetical protein